MTALVWDQTTDRRYEAGVDRGVIYPSGKSASVWPGLTSVTETSVGGDRSSLYYDGVKSTDQLSGRDFRATVTGVTTPKMLDFCLGNIDVGNGLIITNQYPTLFGFTYRTMLNESDYKIHLVYNALARLTKRGYGQNTQGSILDRSWELNATPVPIAGFKPSAHFVIDSTKFSTSMMAALEGQLYGTSTTDPRLPLPTELKGYLTDYLTDPIAEPL